MKVSMYALKIFPWLLLTRIIHELVLRDGEGGRTTGQPQGLEFEGVLEQYVAGWACPEPVEGMPEDARKGFHIHSRSS
jgi:hypothetical protein